MLQQNNNNNYPCLDHTVLQDSPKSSVPFTSPLDFGDMSLIKTLRAWAKSGLSAKARGGTASLHHHHHHHHAKSCQQSNGSAQGSGAPLTARPTTSVPARGLAGVGGQAGLGALVTVATLKASEGGRQTQTRCLLLKAEGRNYVCAVSGANRGSTAGPTAPSRATLVGSWLRDAVVGSKEAPGPKNAARNGPCDGEVFCVQPRPAKKWRKLSNTAATTTETTPNKQDHAVEENQQQPQQQQHLEHHGGKNNCVSTRLNANGGKQARGSAHRGTGRAKDRRGVARAASKQDGLHDAVVLAKENVDIINVPCAAHSSPTVKADLKKTWADCTATRPESKGEANKVATEPSCQISHFTEPPNKEEKNISLHINSLARTPEEANKSLERTGDTVCSAQEKDDPVEQSKEEPAKETLPSTWVSNLSPGRQCCTELGQEKQQCRCKDLDTVFTSREVLPETRPVNKAQSENLNRLSLSDINRSYECVCEEGQSEGGKELDGRVENGPKSTLPNTASPPWQRDEAPQGSVNAEGRSGWTPDEAHETAVAVTDAKDHGKEGQRAARALGTCALSEAEVGGGGGDGVREQQDFGIRSAENNPPWTAPTVSNTATTGVTPTVKALSANPTTTATANANAVTPTTAAHAHPNPAPPGAMATGLPGPRRGQSEAEGGAEAEAETEPASRWQPGQPGPTQTHTADTVATDCKSREGRGGIGAPGGGGGGGGGQGGEEEEEEDEFGGFMQAGEAPVWEEGFAEFHQVPCRNVAVSADKDNVSSWQSDWTANPCHQTDDSWASFSHDPDGQGSEEVIASGQWWPQTAVEDKANDFNAPRVFLEAFPPVPSTTFDLSGIPTLKHLLRGAVEQNRAPEDYGERSLLDGFQDLNKMFGLKHKRTESPSWKRLLASLQVDAHHSTHPKDVPQGHDLASGHAVVSLQTQLVNKRRLSYDLNKNLLA